MILLAGGYLVQAAAMAATAAAIIAGLPLAAYAAAVVAATAVTTTRPAQSTLIPSVASTADQLTAANVVAGWVEAAGIAVSGLLAGVLIALAPAVRRAARTRDRGHRGGAHPHPPARWRGADPAG